jgi:subtilase family serine protease
MAKQFWRAPLLALGILAATAGSASAAISAQGTVANPTTAGTGGAPCNSAGIHCYTPQQIADAYGVSTLQQSGTKGDGQTIVLVDSYGTPTGAQDLQKFHDSFYPSEPNPDFTQVWPNGKPDYSTCSGNGTQHSGPCAAEGWAGEASLDIEWAYAIAPHAHIVLLSVPPAETEGVQGMPNLFKAISNAVDTYPAGTVFSMSFGVDEPTFGGAGASQTAKYDQVFKKGLDKGDTFFSSSGDDGTTGTQKNAHNTGTYSTPTVGWPASSPLVTAVGGTQLQYHWTWNPSSDMPFTAAGNYNPAYFAATQNGSITEPVWNESWLPAATGGGASQIYPRPDWQSAEAGVIGGNHRGVPDLSWNAAVNGGVLVYTSYFPQNNAVGFHIYGGTSAASPQVAGLVALANQQQRESGGKPIGYLNPLLYTKVNSSAFRDVMPMHEGAPGVVSGDLVNNQLFSYNGDGQNVTPGPVPAHPTLAGWDETTGFGSPLGSDFVAQIRAARNSTP